MFRDLMKHQRVFNIHTNFIKKIPKILTPNEYLVKRFNYEGISTGFNSNKYKTYSPFYKFIKDCETFNIHNIETEYLIPYAAKNYYNITKKTGIMFNTSIHGYNKLIPGILDANINSIPLLLISFYNSNEELKISQPEIFKEHYRLTKYEHLPNILEHMLNFSNLHRKGVTHLQIENSILNEKFSPKLN